MVKTTISIFFPLKKIFKTDGHFPHKLEIDFEKQILQIQLYTPELSGLSYNDFALAFKIDGIQESLPKQK
jgi:pterin-4a-carbinolamine dehydratase